MFDYKLITLTLLAAVLDHVLSQTGGLEEVTNIREELEAAAGAPGPVGGRHGCPYAYCPDLTKCCKPGETVYQMYTRYGYGYGGYICATCTAKCMTHCAKPHPYRPEGCIWG